MSESKHYQKFNRKAYVVNLLNQTKNTIPLKEPTLKLVEERKRKQRKEEDRTIVKTTQRGRDVLGERSLIN